MNRLVCRATRQQYYNQQNEFLFVYNVRQRIKRGFSFIFVFKFEYGTRENFKIIGDNLYLDVLCIWNMSLLDSDS